MKQFVLQQWRSARDRVRARHQAASPLGRMFMWIGAGATALVLVLLVLGITADSHSERSLKDAPGGVAALKTHYPVVHYIGPGLSPSVSFQRWMPATWVPLSSVSKVAVGAIIVSEDWAFFQHAGFDANQIQEALKESVEEGRLSRGASTITQQVAKNVFLSNEKTLWRKIKELFLAVKMEKTIGKRRILEIYLNIAEWGEGIYGIGQASRFYFGKHPSQLTVREGAFLAMLLPSPKRYSQSYRQGALSAFAIRIMRSIMGKMVQAHYLTDEELAQALSERMRFETRHPQEGKGDEELEEPGGLSTEQHLEPSPVPGVEVLPQLDRQDVGH